MDAKIHRLEREAYFSLLRAFRARDDALTWPLPRPTGPTPQKSVKYPIAGNRDPGDAAKVNEYSGGNNPFINRKVWTRLSEDFLFEDDTLCEAFISDYNPTEESMIEIPVRSSLNGLI